MTKYVLGNVNLEGVNGIRHLHSTFEERGKLAVNLEKEANWLSI